MNLSHTNTQHILHESSITGDTLSLLGSTADGNTKEEGKAGSEHAHGGEVVLHIRPTVGALRA